VIVNRTTGSGTTGAGHFWEGRIVDENERAQAHFIAAKIEIDRILAQLTNLSSTHFGVAADEVTWGHVGNLHTMVDYLKDAIESAPGGSNNAT
jgi:hypothetical protein